MKVVLFNGSRREDGCTYTALNLVAEELKNSGIEAEIMNVGKRIFNGELTQVVAEAAEKVKTGDGFVFGFPVYWASPTGEIVSFMDRLWGTCGQALKYKPAAAISSARRAGTTATIDVKFPTRYESRWLNRIFTPIAKRMIPPINSGFSRFEIDAPRNTPSVYPTILNTRDVMPIVTRGIMRLCRLV